MFPGQCGNTAFFFKSQPDQFHFEFRGIVFPGKSFFSAHEVSTCKISGCLSYRILDSGPDGTQTTLTLMRGGTAKVYGCDESDLCLGPVVTSLTISESNALVTLVKNLMLSMQNKLVDDTALTDQEKGFVNTTSVPVLKYLTNAQSMGMSATYLLQVSDFIAQDLMIQYLQELVKQASLSLAGKNFPEEAAANYATTSFMRRDFSLT